MGGSALLLSLLQEGMMGGGRRGERELPLETQKGNMKQMNTTAFPPPPVHVLSEGIIKALIDTGCAAFQ